MILAWVLSFLLLIRAAQNNADYDAVETFIIRNPREIDESVEEAQAKLFQVDRAADAVTGIERGVKADPLFIEDQTDQITQQLKADIAKYKAAKKDNVARSDESVISLAKRILKIVTTLEVAKFIADSRARQDVETAERRGIHRPTAYQFPQYNVGYLYGLPSRNPVEDMTQPYQEPQQDSMLAAQSPPASPMAQSQPLSPPAPAPPPAPLPALPAIPPPSLLAQDTPLSPPNQQGLPQGFVPMGNAFTKENPVTPSPKPKTISPPPKHTPKQRVQPQKPHAPENKPSGVITPEDHAQWSIFGESLPMTPPAQYIAPIQMPQIEQPQMPITNQFASAGTTQEQPANPIPQETDLGASNFSASPESSPQELPDELPGLRPLNGDLIKHEHHEKKPDLSVRPPPVQTPPTTPPSPHTEASPAPMIDSSPPAPAVPPPLSPLETPPAPPPVPPLPPAPPVPPPPSFFSQPDLSSQTLLPMSQSVPMVPMPQPQYFVNYIPLNSVPSPMFLPDDTPDVRIAKQKEYESRRSAIAVENIEKAIGLDEKTIESLIDDVKQISLRQKIQYENAILKDKKDEQEADGENKIKTEDKLLRDEELEGKAKETVDQINRLEKIMTIVEAAKFDAQRRANQQLLVAEAWKDRMYGRAKKSKIMKVSQHDSVKKAGSVLEHIVKKERRRRNVNKSSKNDSSAKLLHYLAKNGSRIKRNNLARENP